MTGVMRRTQRLNNALQKGERTSELPRASVKRPSSFRGGAEFRDYIASRRLKNEFQLVHYTITVLRHENAKCENYAIKFPYTRSCVTRDRRGTGRIVFGRTFALGHRDNCRYIYFVWPFRCNGLSFRSFSRFKVSLIVDCSRLQRNGLRPSDVQKDHPLGRILLG